MLNELPKLSGKIQKFGKENLRDILHFTASGLKALFKCQMVRIYLEDLCEGMLICQYATGQNQTKEQLRTKYIAPQGSIISQSFFENQVLLSWARPDGFSIPGNPVDQLSGVAASAVFPIIHQLRPIGTLSLDFGKEVDYLNPDQVDAVCKFLAENGAVIDRAKRFHQQISFSKRLDLARKKEAAWIMLRSAVKLIDKLTLASVLVPSSTQNPQNNNRRPSDLLEILAVYSKNQDDATVYQNSDQISIANKENLINRIVAFDPSRGLVARDKEQEAVFIENILEETFSRKQMARKIDLVSLYQFPKFHENTGQFICAVNYYTNKACRFSDLEKRILKDHAAMVERMILEENPEHIEIQVLGEIEELLSEDDSSLNRFLNKILDKTSELIGADSGTISILKMLRGKPWLVVEDAEGKLMGAKSRGWMKSKIPPLPVGGEELREEMKSLNGYCAHTARPILVKNVNDKGQTHGFYKTLSPSIRSELAVPLIYGNGVLGVLNQDSFRKNYFTEEHKKILQIIASLIAQKVYTLKQIEDLRQEITHLKKDIEYRDPKVSSYHFGNVIGKSANIHSLVGQINTVVESICNRMLHWANGNATEAIAGLPCLLIEGETGSGKEFFFNNIYSRITEVFQKAKRSNYKLPLRKTNIAAYSGDLSYSELFGHKKGAFTGAEFNRQGILEEADGGVVFLDEIGDADPKTQVQLLRFLDTGVFMRLGENQPRESRIFLIAATNKNLRMEIEKGKFREDLYHRLNALSFHIPRLNDRLEDIEDLATHFLGILFQTYKNDSAEEAPPYLEPDAIDALKNYTYRGNVRELKNILLRAMLFRRGPVISRENIDAALQTQPAYPPAPGPSNQNQFIESLLDRLDQGDGDFWSDIHQPFKKNTLTRDTVQSIISAAKSRYQTNLPGLAVKLGVYGEGAHTDPQEQKRLISFKNFLYKTIKISRGVNQEKFL